MSTHRTTREILELQSARMAPMYERLKRAQAERDESEHRGSGDLRHYLEAANREQHDAMTMIGWILALAFLCALGGLLGWAGASWWTGDEGLTQALACLRGM